MKGVSRGNTLGVDGVDYLGSGDNNWNCNTDDDRERVYTHYRKINTTSGGSHSHTFNMNNAGEHNHPFTTENKGDGKAHENRPPYYALAFIMFKGF